MATTPIAPASGASVSAVDIEQSHEPWMSTSGAPPVPPDPPVMIGFTAPVVAALVDAALLEAPPAPPSTAGTQ